MFKIAHISDLHISFEDEDEHGKRFVELLKDIKSRDCQHIFLTGDIVENPKLRDILYVKEILSYFNLLDNSKLSVVPGNHDIFGGAPKGKLFFLFSLLCKELNYDDNLDIFNDSFNETFPDNHNTGFPYLKILNGNIAVIGVNSNARWSLRNNPEGSNGEIYKEDFGKLKELLSSPEIKGMYKIVLLHHHFNKPCANLQYPAHSLWLKVVNRKMKLYSKGKILRLFKKHKVNLVLHGHTHINESYKSKKVSLLNSSACIYPLTDDQLRMYNIISIPEESETHKAVSIETIIIE